MRGCRCQREAPNSTEQRATAQAHLAGGTKAADDPSTEV
jgi:hypothetical protein